MKKTVFVSGASKGLGFAIAKKFYDEGFEVIICARGEQGLEEAKAKMPKVHSYACDISKKEQVKSLASEIQAKFGSLDVLVNNGGTFIQAVLHEEEDEILEKLIDTNLYSAYYFSKAFVPAMKDKKQGTIFNICSVASLQSYPAGGSYTVSKFALLGFSKALRQELMEFGIRVISILPGATKTPAWDGVDLPEERFIPADDVGKLIYDIYQLSERSVVEEILIRPMLGDI